MRILFVSATLPPEGTATANIVGNLMIELKNRGNSVSGLTFKSCIRDAEVSIWNGVDIIYANYVREYGYKSCSIFDDFVKGKRKIYDWLHKSPKRPYRELAVKSLLKAMNEMDAGNAYDIVIAVAAFYDTVEAVRRYKNKYQGNSKAKYIFYQVDPLEENRAFSQIDEQWLDRYENDIYEQADHVFTTREIYVAKEKKQWNLGNVTAVDFPCVNLKMAGLNSSIVKSKNEIRCVYAGLLNEQVRDATRILEILSRIRNPQIVFYFIGQGQEELLHKYSENTLRGRLHILGSMPAKECEEWLLSADALLIIGNNATNQVPSKVFSYMSYGLPIIATCKAPDCPSVPYLEIIPNAIIIREDDFKENIDTLALQIEGFIMKHKNTRLSSEQIGKYAFKYTPEHIVDIFVSFFDTQE